jgi:hypothetical protein
MEKKLLIWYWFTTYSGMPKACTWVWSKRAVVCPKRALQKVIHSRLEARAENTEKLSESVTALASGHMKLISKEGF